MVGVIFDVICAVPPPGGSHVRHDALQALRSKVEAVGREGHRALVVSLVLAPGSMVTVKMLSSGKALLVMDGQEAEEIGRNDEVDMQLAHDRVHVFENPERPFLRMLQAKLGWQGTERRSL